MRRPGGFTPLSPQAWSSLRLALVACALVTTVGVLFVVTLSARSAENALDDAASHTLHDYAGYAGRIFGAELLRRFAEQRQTILAPVSASTSAADAPTLAAIISRGASYFAALSSDPRVDAGYFRLDLRTGHADSHDIPTPLLQRITDTLRVIPLDNSRVPGQNIMTFDFGGAPRSVAYMPRVNAEGVAEEVYGYTYSRATGVGAMSRRVFDEVPLLPLSHSGPRWNYDTTVVRRGEVRNDPMLGVRVQDRAGRVLWQSPGSSFDEQSSFRERVVLSTIAGGIEVATVLSPESEPLLFPGAVRAAQRWSLRALFGLAVLLLIVSLAALRNERIHAASRRMEAMEQLARALKHEMNNALASAMLDAELLSEEKGFDDNQRERLLSIVEQTSRMRDVLRKLEKTDELTSVVPYLGEEYMVDLSRIQTRVSITTDA